MTSTTTTNKSANVIYNLINYTEQFGDQKIDIIICGEDNTRESWFKGNDIATILGYEKPRKAISDNIYKNDRLPLEQILDIARSNKKCNGNQKKTIYINRRGLTTLLTYSKMPNKSNFIRWCKDAFDINYDIITRLYKEQETIGQLIIAFKYLNYQTQYKSDSYRIDLYFIDYKLAIECDEFNHVDRNQEYEIKRENDIKRKLNCKFIRYNPDDAAFDIFNLINKIIQHILNY